MSCFAQTTTGDLDFSSHGLQIVPSGAQATCFRLFNRFRRWLGDWFLNTSEGIPFLSVILIKNPDIATIESLFKNVITTCPGVASITSFTTNYNPATRVLNWSFIAKAADGSTIVGGAGQPFIVQP